VQRYLADEPVVAPPPSKLYRLQKMARRNKLAFAAGAAVLLALVRTGGVEQLFIFVRKLPMTRRTPEQEPLAGSGRVATPPSSAQSTCLFRLRLVPWKLSHEDKAVRHHQSCHQRPAAPRPRRNASLLRPRHFLEPVQLAGRAGHDRLIGQVALHVPGQTVGRFVTARGGLSSKAFITIQSDRREGRGMISLIRSSRLEAAPSIL